MAELSRRAMLGLIGLGVVGTAISWPRLTGGDIPGRGDDALTVALFGTAQDAAARQELVAGFQRLHPGIPVRIVAIQGQDWSSYFAKILTMVAAGTPPDVVTVATEGTQLFASRMAYPIDEYVQRDAAEMQDYFDDVHPSLVEAFLYKGNLFQLPDNFNAANVYYNTSALERAGLERPSDNWTLDDFFDVARKMKSSASGNFLPYFWNNRLWGGVVPWLYVNDTSFLTEEKASGGDWLWKQFYPNETPRGGGYLWENADALNDRTIESFSALQQMVGEGLAANPAQGGGNELVALFARGSVGMTPAGGFWVQGLKDAGFANEDYDVTFFPKMRSQRHQFGAGGYAIMQTSQRKDEAWEWLKYCVSVEGMSIAHQKPDSSLPRRTLNDQLYGAGVGPKNWQVFYDTLDKFPTTGPMPAPPQQAAVESALIKNVVSTITNGPDGVRRGLETMQRDLELALRGR
ncbi:ABC transporter substrate-binding protein [Microbacterium sp. No. 7]|uniref:ABC transporter substrate-binding protein n=1 Tax=Microbacterium sp. No. 7 TaxID=1714373 RepID=UPI000ABEF1FF|nr:sugar ABC transporter substrate-binding protein [Microbacterium sp. No. 7]